MRQATLHPSDVVVALELTRHPRATYAQLAEQVGLSVGEVHNAVRRLRLAGLVSRADRHVVLSALLQFLTAGVPYAFPAELGAETRGVATAGAAAPLSDELSPHRVVVWPSADGRQRGQSLTPLYPRAPELATRNRPLYELLALVDAVRLGDAREQRRAKELLEQRLRREP